jgi:signal transduction histidine kinase
MMKMSVDSEDYVNEGSSMLRRVSHEVKNPLTIIGNYAEVLNHSLANTESRELTQSIKKEVRRIDDILNYYLNRQEIPGFPEPSIDLNQLVLDTVDALSDVVLKPRQIEIRFDLQNNLENVATNPVLVKQILINLLKNSAEAVSDSGVIELMTRGGYSSDNGRHIEVIVQDNGSGIPSELQKKLFQPIVSTNGASHAGVGLNIVEGMVNDLGGRISCYSTAEAGTSFHLQIPCKVHHPEAS